MELAKQFFTDVLSERIQLTSPPNTHSTECEKTKSSLALEADRSLEIGLTVTIHVLMGHEGCKLGGRAKDMCPAMQRLETWTFKLHRKRPSDATDRPPILPLFLKQAIRSQLHFSSLRSWLTANPTLTTGLFPVVRVLIGDKSKNWPVPADQIQCHQFPPCCIVNSPTDGLWLQLGVQWLKREHFQQESPLCPAVEMDGHDAWMLPPDNCDDSEEPCPSCSDSESPGDSPPNLPSQRWKEPAGGEVHVHRRHQSKTRRRSSKSREQCQQQKADKVEQQQQKLQQHSTAIPSIPEHCPTAQGQFQQPRTRLPGSPVPHFRHRFPGRKSSTAAEVLLVHRRTPEKAIQQQNEAIEPRQSQQQQQQQQLAIPIPQRRQQTTTSSNRFAGIRRFLPTQRLLCNFEESILNGRILPSNTVDGYRLQLTVVPAPQTPLGFSSQRVSLPVQTCFYNEIDDRQEKQPTRTPTSLHLARCQLDPEGIPISRHCNLQAVLFNPQGSVVKLFMVCVDVRDMPAGSTTFIRQRTFSETGTEETGRAAEDGGNATPVSRRPRVPASALRFLIHLRLASNETGQVRLHTDIRMLFSNKANDLEGLESILCGQNPAAGAKSTAAPMAAGTGKMRSVAEMPEEPKYSPVK